MSAVADRKLRRRVVGEVFGVFAWSANAALSAAHVWPVRYIPWWLCITFAACGFGWLMGTAGARPGLFDDPPASLAVVGAEKEGGT